MGGAGWPSGKLRALGLDKRADHSYPWGRVVCPLDPGRSTPSYPPKGLVTREISRVAC